MDNFFLENDSESVMSHF